MQVVHGYIHLATSPMYAGGSQTLLHPPCQQKHIWRWFIYFITSMLSIKTHQRGSNNVIFSATAHTRPGHQTERCGAASFTQTPYVSHHLARALSGGQLHCHV